MLDAVQDGAVFLTEDDVAVLAHQLNDEALLPQISQLIEVLDLKLDDTLKSRWDTLTMRPVPMCFLSSMQKFGAVSGLGLLVSVKYTRGRLALADTERRRVSLLFLR